VEQNAPIRGVLVITAMSAVPAASARALAGVPVATKTKKEDITAPRPTALAISLALSGSDHASQ